MEKEFSNILREIVQLRKKDVEIAKQTVSIDELKHRIHMLEKDAGNPVDIVSRIRKDFPAIAIAAEFKRASPSKGDIAPYADVKNQAKEYANASASIISVLTEPNKFKGSLQDMLDVYTCIRQINNRPAILRKDFIIDEYQLYEARAYGGDSVLLIVAILDIFTLTTLIQKSRELSMEPLVEVNNENELDIALQVGSRLIGVNNRNLNSFVLDLNTTVRLAKSIEEKGRTLGPEDITLIALSGVTSREDVVMFEKCGCAGVLVGDILMRSRNIKEQIHQLKSSSFKACYSPLVKICGIKDTKAALTALQAGANMIGMIFIPGADRWVDKHIAKEIVQTVRQYGERKEKIDLLNQIHGLKTNKYFQDCSFILERVCTKTPLVVGVFSNQKAEEINQMIDEIGFDLVQLHGDEGFKICKEIHTACIRVVHLPHVLTQESVNMDAIIQHIEEGYAIAILLDSTVKGQKVINDTWMDSSSFNAGGTGTTFDWTIANTFRLNGIPCILAGGLNPENVGKCIRLAHPLGVDVSSGVENGIEKGVKNLEKIKRFIKKAKHFSLYSNEMVMEDDNDDDEIIASSK